MWVEFPQFIELKGGAPSKGRPPLPPPKRTDPITGLWDATRPCPSKHRLQHCQIKEMFSKVGPACLLSPGLDR